MYGSNQFVIMHHASRQSLLRNFLCITHICFSFVFALSFYFQDTVNHSAAVANFTENHSSPNKDNKNEEQNYANKNQDEENRIDQAAIEASQKLNPV